MIYMRVLIYKRTHKHDPDERGIFGIEDCMGQVRNWNYDAVIGIGGKSVWKGHEDIKYKINWIGMDPKRINPHPNRKISKVVFSKFELYEENGKNIEEHYPNLFKYMYVDGNRKRFDMSPNLPENVLKEVKEILDSIKNSPASKEYDIDRYDDLEASKCNSHSKCGGCFSGEKFEVTFQECIKENTTCKK